MDLDTCTYYCIYCLLLTRIKCCLLYYLIYCLLLTHCLLLTCNMLLSVSLHSLPVVDLHQTCLLYHFIHWLSYIVLCITSFIAFCWFVYIVLCSTSFIAYCWFVYIVLCTTSFIAYCWLVYIVLCTTSFIVFHWPCTWRLHVVAYICYLCFIYTYICIIYRGDRGRLIHGAGWYTPEIEP